MARKNTSSVLQGRSIHINSVLRRFFDDVVGFRRVMRETGALISGSQTLALLLDLHFPGADLDVFVAEEYGDELLGFVVGEGYREVTRYDRSDLFDDDMYPSVTGVTSVTTLRKESTIVQLIEVAFSPTSSILMFHSTAVMNFSTWNRFISLYPRATARRISYALPPRNPNDEERTALALKKYEDRGFEIRRHVTASEPPFLFPLGDRKIGDSHCLVVKYRDDNDDDKLGDCTPTEEDMDIDSHGWTAMDDHRTPNHVFDFVVHLQPTPKHLHTHSPFEDSRGGRFLHILDKCITDYAF